MPHENEDASMSHKEFLEKALTGAGEWVRYADPKALGVAVFLTFGATDLLRNSERLYHGFTKNSVPEWIMTLSLLGAFMFGITTVVCISLAVFPRLKPKGPRSLFYFGGIAQVTGPEEYEQEVRKMGPQELESQIAHQAWNVAKLAETKHRWSKRAYFSLLVSFAFWVAGRIALYFVQ
jgi:hypothetical protein